MKSTNKKNHIIGIKWPYFVVFLIINCVVCLYAAHVINDPSDYEIFYLFLGAYDTKTAELKERIMSDTNFPILRRFYVKYSCLSNPTFKTDLNTYGLVHSDLLILPLSILDGLPSYDSMCQSFSEEYALKTFGESYSYLRKDDNLYGVKVYDATSDTGIFKSMISYTALDKPKEDYYISFKRTSIHLGDMAESTQTNHAITIAKGILANDFEA